MHEHATPKWQRQGRVRSGDAGMTDSRPASAEWPARDSCCLAVQSHINEIFISTDVSILLLRTLRWTKFKDTNDNTKACM